LVVEAEELLRQLRVVGANAGLGACPVVVDLLHPSVVPLVLGPDLRLCVFLAPERVVVLILNLLVPFERVSVALEILFKLSRDVGGG
jgi:hypothetical protein